MKKQLILACAFLAFCAVSCNKETPAESSSDETYFSLPSMDGGKIDLKDYAGKPVMVMFFTETCPFCRKAGPEMQKIHEKYSSRGFSVIGISLKDSPESPRRFAADLGIKFPLAYGGKEIGRKYKVQGVPFIYLLDKNHKIYDNWMGYDESYLKEMQDSVEQTLK